MQGLQSMCCVYIPPALQLRSISTGTVNRGMAVSGYEYETLAVSQPREWVTEVRLNRPEKRNAMNQAFWRCVCACCVSLCRMTFELTKYTLWTFNFYVSREMVDCFQRLSEDSSCRVVLLTGEGKNFTSGVH